MDSSLQKIKELNKCLKDKYFCLPLPQHLVSKNIEHMSKIQDPNDLLAEVVKCIMNIDQRVLQYVSRYQHVPFFKKNDKFIRSALSCYFLQEYESSQLTIILCLESILQQWLFPKRSSHKKKKEKKENFNLGDWKVNFIESWDKLLENAPTDHVRMLLTEYKDYGDHMIRKFYMNTNKNKHLSGFNRHEATHFLRDMEVSNANIARLFLLLDIVCELIYLENNGYQNICAFTYIDSVLEKVPSEINEQRKNEHKNLSSFLLEKALISQIVQLRLHC